MGGEGGEGGREGEWAIMCVCLCVFINPNPDCCCWLNEGIYLYFHVNEISVIHHYGVGNSLDETLPHLKHRIKDDQSIIVCSVHL